MISIELVTDDKFLSTGHLGRKKEFPHPIQPQLWDHTVERFCSYMEILSASLCQWSDFSPSLLNSLAVSVDPLNVTRLEFKKMYPEHFNLLQHSSQAKQ